jgi:hypothetical protein
MPIMLSCCGPLPRSGAAGSKARKKAKKKGKKKAPTSGA